MKFVGVYQIRDANRERMFPRFCFPGPTKTEAAAIAPATRPCLVQRSRLSPDAAGDLFHLRSTMTHEGGNKGTVHYQQLFEESEGIENTMRRLRKEKPKILHMHAGRAKWFSEIVNYSSAMLRKPQGCFPKFKTTAMRLNADYFCLCFVSKICKMWVHTIN